MVKMDQPAAYFTWLITECDYRDVTPLPSDKWCAIAPFAFTHAIIIGRNGNPTGYDDRWCYHSYAAAKAALVAWDGTGEPAGWHRHPASGRRVSQDADEQDEDGKRVGAAGIIYVRQ